MSWELWVLLGFQALGFTGKMVETATIADKDKVAARVVGTMLGATIGVWLLLRVAGVL